MNLVTDTTTDSSGLALRDAIDCSAVTICELATIGSTVWCGIAAWPPRPVTVMSKMSVAAMIGPLTDRELADRQAGQIVHAEHLGDAEAFHHSVIDHLAATTAALFGRLKDHRHRSGEIPGGGEMAGCAKQHGGMAVMSAGVHLAGSPRRPRHACCLFDGKGIHIGAQADGRSIAAGPAMDDTDNAGAADAGDHFVATKGFQFFGDKGCGVVHVKQQFGVGVNGPAPFGDFILLGDDVINKLHLCTPVAVGLSDGRAKAANIPIDRCA
jgi:hypothetical protein